MSKELSAVNHRLLSSMPYVEPSELTKTNPHARSHHRGAAVSTSAAFTDCTAELRDFTSLDYLTCTQSINSAELHTQNEDTLLLHSCFYLFT